MSVHKRTRNFYKKVSTITNNTLVLLDELNVSSTSSLYQYSKCNRNEVDKVSDVKDILTHSEFEPPTQTEQINIVDEGDDIPIIDLKKLGGEDTKKMIRRMLERLLTFKLGSMYTWDGARGKRVFGTLSISQVIKSACATTQRHNTTEDEVERFIKEWLRRAKVRCIQTEKKMCMLPSNKQ